MAGPTGFEPMNDGVKVLCTQRLVFSRFFIVNLIVVVIS